jgi:type VI secretion system FHA domain protein
MSLKLSIESYSGKPPLALNRVIFDKEGGSIGRLSGNTWVLDDPEHYISGRHALINYQKPHYYLTDTSTNGVYINHSLTPLGNGNTALLSQGDILEIGEYEITVIINQEDTETSNLKPPGSPGNDALLKDPFADLGSSPIDPLLKGESIKRSYGAPSDQEYSPFPEIETVDQSYPRGSEANHTPDIHTYFEPVKGIQKETIEEPFRTDQTSGSSISIPENWMELDNPDSSREDNKKITSFPIKTPPIPSSLTPEEHPDHVGNEAQIIRKFLSGAGLNDNNIAPSLDPDIFFTVGKVLRTTVQGAMDVLMARATIKNEMRLDVTTLHSTENNPIKFSVSVDDALIRLLTPQKKEYTPPVEAIEEAFEDIRVHQLAVLAGMQTALGSIVKRFDPKVLEKRLQKTNPLSANIPIHRKAKLWELFEMLYEEIGQEAEDDFNLLFGHAFIKAYEAQIKSIKDKKEHI